MEVICLQDEAFYELLETAIERIQAKNSKDKFKWIPPLEAMALLNVKKTKLQNLRDEGKIRYSQPDRKTILYDRDSIAKFLEENAQNTFKL